MEEKRLAMNGKPYTEQQFEEYYGDKAKEYWNEAAARSLQSCESTVIAAEHGENPASQPTLQISAEIQASVAVGGKLSSIDENSS